MSMNRVCRIIRRTLILTASVMTLLWVSTAFATTITMDIVTLQGRPPDFDPEHGDHELSDFTRLALPRPHFTRFHVNIEPGIGDLHIRVPGGQVNEPGFIFTQDLFPTQEVGGGNFVRRFVNPVVGEIELQEDGFANLSG